MRTVLIIILLSFFSSCTEKKAIEVINMSKPNLFEGTWKDKKDSNNWVFGESKMSYGGYSHFYIAQKDTLLISGIPYEIKFSNKDSMVLYSTRLKSMIYLIKE